MTNVLVSGANGQLGKTIKEKFAFSDDLNFFFMSKKELDITSTLQVNKVFKERNFHFCVNCAAYTNVESAEENKKDAFLVNEKGVENLALECKKSEVVLIHISTDYVFDGLKDMPYTEEDSVNPINTYGKSKLAGENILKKTLNKYYIIRTSWLYSKHGKNFLKTIAQKIEENKELNIITTQKGKPTSCIDLARFIVHIIENSAPYGTYHFSALNETTWFDFAKEIASYYNYYDSSKLNPAQTISSLAKRPQYSVLDVEKASRIFPKIKAWQESLKQVIGEI